MAADISTMWDFTDPQLSERRFRAALTEADAEQTLILQTQIARTYSLRGDFDTARRLLTELEPDLASASAAARVHFNLELGRTYVSATRQAADTDEQQQARTLYLNAYQLASQAQLDVLAVDALHMMAFIDSEPAQQLKWAQQALTVVEASEQPAAQKWEASLRNNAGYALHQLEHYDEALQEFQRALALRERSGNPWTIHVAHWMVAWTLRATGRTDEALTIQLRLERERDAAGEPDASVYEELATLYEARGDRERALHYTSKLQALE